MKHGYKVLRLTDDDKVFKSASPIDEEFTTFYTVGETTFAKVKDSPLYVYLDKHSAFNFYNLKCATCPTEQFTVYECMYQPYLIPSWAWQYNIRFKNNNLVKYWYNQRKTFMSRTFTGKQFTPDYTYAWYVKLLKEIK